MIALALLLLVAQPDRVVLMPVAECQAQKVFCSKGWQKCEAGLVAQTASTAVQIALVKELQGHIDELVLHPVPCPEPPAVPEPTPVLDAILVIAASAVGAGAGALGGDAISDSPWAPTIGAAVGAVVLGVAYVLIDVSRAP